LTGIVTLFQEEEEEEEEASHATTSAAHPVSDNVEGDMDDERYREILSPEQPLPLPFQFQELSGPKPSPDSSPIAYFPSLLHRLYHYPQSDRIQQICAA
jgi:hypothetical protein